MNKNNSDTIDGFVLGVLLGSGITGIIFAFLNYGEFYTFRDNYSFYKTVMPVIAIIALYVGWKKLDISERQHKLLHVPHLNITMTHNSLNRTNEDSVYNYEIELYLDNNGLGPAKITRFDWYWKGVKLGIHDTSQWDNLLDNIFVDDLGMDKDTSSAFRKTIKLHVYTIGKLEYRSNNTSILLIRLDTYVESDDLKKSILQILYKNLNYEIEYQSLADNENLIYKTIDDKIDGLHTYNSKKQQMGNHV